METHAIRQLDDMQRQRLEVYRSQVTPAWAWPSIGIAVFLFLVLAGAALAVATVAGGRLYDRRRADALIAAGSSPAS